MKKIKIIILGVLLASKLLYSQNQILVVYEHTRGVPFNIVTHEVLVANNKSAIYRTDSLLIQNKENNITKEDEDGNRLITINPKAIRLNANDYYLKKDNNIIYFTGTYNNNPVLVKDSLPDYSWKISEKETKKIGDFTCRKALTNFRGSEITAWYAEEINIPYGPWKFKGLPGLILELYTTNNMNRFNWRAHKIKYPFNKKVEYNKDDNLRIVNHKKIVLEKERKINELSKVSATRVPKGVKLVESKIVRTGIEKTYEWEEEEEKQD